MKINLNKTIIAAAVCAFATIAAAQDQTATNSNGWAANENHTMTAQSYVNMAATTDMKEIHLGELALQKSDNSKVKSYARRIVADHKKACKKLEAIAMKEGLNFPDTNSMSWGMNSMNDRWHTNSQNYVNHSMWPTNADVSMSENPDKDSPPHAGTVLASKETYVTNNMVDYDEHDSSSAMNFTSLSGAEFDRAFVSHMIQGHKKAIRKFEMASANLQDQQLKMNAEKMLPTLREHLHLAQNLQSEIGMSSDSGMTNSMHNYNQ